MLAKAKKDHNTNNSCSKFRFKPKKTRNSYGGGYGYQEDMSDGGISVVGLMEPMKAVLDKSYIERMSGSIRIASKPQTSEHLPKKEEKG